MGLALGDLLGPALGLLLGDSLGLALGDLLGPALGLLLGDVLESATLKLQVATRPTLSLYFTVTVVVPIGNKSPLVWVVETREGVGSQSSTAVVVHVATPEPAAKTV